MTATVEALFIASGAGRAMERVTSVEALEGQGLAGDRYAARTGYWTAVDECQVTLIEAEALDQIAAEAKLRVAAGEHRRNIVTRGIALEALVGRRFRIGGALLEYDRPRPPCRYVETLTEPGMTRALARAGGGICARVVAAGPIRVGDAIEIEA